MLASADQVTSSFGKFISAQSSYYARNLDEQTRKMNVPRDNYHDFFRNASTIPRFPWRSGRHNLRGNDSPRKKQSNVQNGSSEAEDRKSVV